MGEHILILNSTGTDFFTINSLIFTHFQNPLRALTLQGFGRVLGWVKIHFMNLNNINIDSINN